MKFTNTPSHGVDGREREKLSRPFCGILLPGLRLRPTFRSREHRHAAYHVTNRAKSQLMWGWHMSGPLWCCAYRGKPKKEMGKRERERRENETNEAKLCGCASLFRLCSLPCSGVCPFPLVHHAAAGISISRQALDLLSWLCAISGPLLFLYTHHYQYQTLVSFRLCHASRN